MGCLFRVGLTVWFLFVAVQSSAREPAGICREPECGRTENDRTNQDRNKKQDDKKQQDNSKAKDGSPCGPNPPERGFVYKDQRGNGTVHADPSAGSEVVGTPPNGSRLMYDRVSESGGRRWYHVNPSGGRSGWLPASDVGCTRPPVPPPYRGPIRDCDIPTAESHSEGGMAGRGYAPGSFCDQYQQQQEPVSLR